MKLIRCECGYVASDDLDLQDHLQESFTPQDGKAPDGSIHDESTVERGCLCGHSASSAASQCARALSSSFSLSQFSRDVRARSPTRPGLRSPMAGSRRPVQAGRRRHSYWLREAREPLPPQEFCMRSTNISRWKARTGHEDGASKPRIKSARGRRRSSRFRRRRFPEHRSHECNCCRCWCRGRGGWCRARLSSDRWRPWCRAT